MPTGRAMPPFSRKRVHLWHEGVPGWHRRGNRWEAVTSLANPGDRPSGQEEQLLHLSVQYVTALTQDGNLPAFTVIIVSQANWIFPIPAGAS